MDKVSAQITIVLYVPDLVSPRILSEQYGSADTATLADYVNDLVADEGIQSLVGLAEQMEVRVKPVRKVKANDCE